LQLQEKKSSSFEASIRAPPAGYEACWGQKTALAMNKKVQQVNVSYNQKQLAPVDLAAVNGSFGMALMLLSRCNN
jgi:hypothetical protein